jgi:hypothetical protein
MVVAWLYPMNTCLPERTLCSQTRKNPGLRGQPVYDNAGRHGDEGKA